MFRWILKWGGLAGVGALAVLLVLLLHDLPAPKEPITGGTVAVLDRDGGELAVYGAPGSRAVPLERLPEHLIDAVIAIEDRRFHSHFGLDPLGIARALWTNVTSGRVVQGGSTITQQLAKNLYLESDRTLKRKAQEAVLALLLEARFSKDRILELYLNRVYLGAGTYGVEAAAQRYFAKPAARLTLRESALIAGLLKAPSRYDPTRNPSGSAERMRLVVESMVDAGRLSEEEAKAVLQSPPVPVARPRQDNLQYATDWAREQVALLAGDWSGDIKVWTTIDRRIQSAAADALARHLGGEGQKRKAGQGAVVVLDQDGAVRAMVGGKDYGRSQYNRAVRARRQPGSAFKPFVYLAALENGWSPNDVIEDSPVAVGDWRPQNYGDRYLGRVTLTEALARSANTASVRLSESIGRDKGIEMAHRLGINSDIPDHPSVVLGTAEVNVLELAAAYAPIGNGGQGVLPHIVLRIEDENGQVLMRRRGGGPGRVLAARDAARMAAMLQAVMTYGSGQGARIDRPAGGKTGTTQDNRDAWFVGITADMTAAVWVGNDNNAPMQSVTGSGLPARIWRDVMLAAHRGMPARPLPEAPGVLATLRDTVDPPARADDEAGGLWGRIRDFLDGRAGGRERGSGNTGNREESYPGADYEVQSSP
ncbi:transglycosylase domain-containing protein [Minwuia thermotolerans]|uniref:Uncharacterized protein n=1 Tax=Minwuia thermotolerans TaxID=2056226 RepID=A0A2M9G5H4_9PROT|nr:PBP1A family penicillin-binding protein [Minwuia thermotolerans]PJK30954.1 hypothetical protein CVT23_03565 [Minwuia thermotolerans]